MTSSKADIAEQLAWRDKEIRNERVRLRRALESLRSLAIAYNAAKTEAHCDAELSSLEKREKP